MNNIGLYVHFPFCIQKCNYCDFYSTTNLSNIDTYLSALTKEIYLRSNAYSLKNFSVNSVFVGGGTPSLLSSQQLNLLIDAIKMHCNVSDDCEITMECNPGASDSRYFEDYRKIGVNRLSIGVQSFNDTELMQLQRIHKANEAIRTIEKARQAFDNISIDLMFAIPGQKIKTLENSLKTAIETGCDHISLYSLIFEEGTPLFDEMIQGRVVELDSDNSADMYLFACDYLRRNGYEHYEISSFAKESYRSRHNLKYWRSQDVVAFGASAVGLFDSKRYKNVDNLGKYCRLLNIDELLEISREMQNENDKITEAVFLSLRSEGLDFDEFKNNFGIDLFDIAENDILQFINNDFAVFRSGILKLTAKGYLVCDEITLKLLKIIKIK